MVALSTGFINNKFSADGPYFEEFGQTIYVILTILSSIIILAAFYKFYGPMSSIFVDQFDWETALKDMSEASKKDQYYVDPEKEWVCEYCGNIEYCFKQPLCKPCCHINSGHVKMFKIKR